MSTLFWLSFLFATPPAHANACAAHGTPLLEIRHRSELASSSPTTERIYSSGAWTIETDAGTTRGCFSRPELNAIRRAVQRATWHVTTSPIRCFAYDPNFTEYMVNGHLRYTARMCSGKTADSVTLESIHFVEQELAPAP